MCEVERVSLNMQRCEVGSMESLNMLRCEVSGAAGQQHQVLQTILCSGHVTCVCTFPRFPKGMVQHVITEGTIS